MLGMYGVGKMVREKMGGASMGNGTGADVADGAGAGRDRFGRWGGDWGPVGDDLGERHGGDDRGGRCGGTSEGADAGAGGVTVWVAIGGWCGR